MQFTIALLALLPAVLATPAAADDEKMVVPACNCKNDAGEYNNNLCLLTIYGIWATDGKHCFAPDEGYRMDQFITDAGCAANRPGYKAECVDVTVCKGPIPGTDFYQYHQC
ncbi:hypothetical protein PG999_007439 [Apiospora kogelbergensis]|uniref:Uncharacterized protein n=1 Tax=Apiospora kogelbergensis TaxID=1337665 RepID=A0AAW0QYB3_9PEZI